MSYGVAGGWPLQDAFCFVGQAFLPAGWQAGALALQHDLSIYRESHDFL
jgi:hypothetical protein